MSHTSQAPQGLTGGGQHFGDPLYFSNHSDVLVYANYQALMLNFHEFASDISYETAKQHQDTKLDSNMVFNSVKAPVQNNLKQKHNFGNDIL